MECIKIAGAGVIRISVCPKMNNLMPIYISSSYNCKLKSDDCFRDVYWLKINFSRRAKEKNNLFFPIWHKVNQFSTGWRLFRTIVRTSIEPVVVIHCLFHVVWKKA